MQGRLKFHRNDQSGFSLMEVLIAMGLLGGLVAFGMSNFTRTQALRNLVEDRFVLGDLEEEIRRAVFSNVSLTITGRENQALQNCLQRNGKNCPMGRQSIDLWLREGRKVTGNYDGAIKKCAGINCLVEVRTQFEGMCGNPNTCDQAKYIIFHYQILANGTLMKRGQLRRIFDRHTSSDDNLACDVDQVGRTQFVNQLRPSSLQCLASPPLSRQVQGIQAADCRPGIELLAGFGAGGAAICQPIKFNQGNNRR